MKLSGKNILKRNIERGLTMLGIPYSPTWQKSEVGPEIIGQRMWK